MSDIEIFDEWPEKYDQWFETPIGRLIKQYESALILHMLNPGPGEKILDAGCGTGIFTFDLLSAGAEVLGLEISLPMLLRAGKKLKVYPFRMLQADMRHLPFTDGAFDKAVSVTAVEFLEDAKPAIDELFRVTRPGGCIVVATLNSRSSWAGRRKEAAKKGHSLFKKAFFRSPEEIRTFSPLEGVIKTAIHFEKSEHPIQAERIEKEGQMKGLDTGAFLVARWEKPE